MIAVVITRHISSWLQLATGDHDQIWSMDQGTCLLPCIIDQLGWA
jgi:hypothetical protein